MNTLHSKYKGPIAWMACNPIAANLLMLLVMVAGIYAIATIKKEVFPSFPSETLTITVPYPGSSPAEVEEGVIIKIEEAIADIPGIKEIRSQASEGSAVITVDILPGLDINDTLNKVKTRVDAISSLPAEAEQPIIEEMSGRTQVLSLTLAGPLDEQQLKQQGDEIRERLLQLPSLTQVSILSEREYEISIELSEHALQAYGLRFDDVVRRIQQQSRDLPGGRLRTSAQNFTLRSSGQARNRADYEQLIVLQQDNGSQLRLKDIASVNDGFSEQPILTEFNNQPAITLQVDRIGEQSALAISRDVRQLVETLNSSLPEGVSLTVWADRTTVLKGRIELLLNSAMQGALLVIIALSLFLRPQLAFWVVVGVPFCFLGALALMGTPWIGHSINVISLFGFILVLGIVIDDAIVTAESAFYTLEKENDGINSIIKGVRNVATATVFGVITTIIAFLPMLFMTEGISRLFVSAATVVVLCLALSIIETKFILPAHLRHIRIRQASDYTNPLAHGFIRFQDFFSQGLLRFAEYRYRPFLQRCLAYRYITLAVFVGFLLISSQLVPSGLLRFIFFPNVPSDFITVNLEMPRSTHYSMTHQYAETIRDAGWTLNERYRQVTGEDRDVIDNLSLIANSDSSAEIRVALIPSTERDITSVEMVNWWREALGELPGIKSLTFDGNAGRNSLPINLRFESDNLDTLRLLASEVKQTLGNYEGLFDINDSFDSGARELDIRISEQGRALGLGQAELARQVRQAFFGAEVQRIQRGRHEVRVYVRFPADQRNSINTLESMWIRLPDGSEAPFSQLAWIENREAISTINRIDRQRVVNVTANLDKARHEPGRILADLQATVLPDILARYPDVDYQLAGEAEEQQGNVEVMLLTSLIMLMMIYSALAIPLKSWLQPLLIMSVIPFGIQGALIGHLLMGKEISVISIVGIVALAGIVVNDSLVLIDYINQKMRQGESWRQAVAFAGERRFRAVILTSVTTFLGLLPIQLETSIQAQFLKPMAISVAFGVLLATVVTLLLVPVLCYIADDLRLLWHKAWHRLHGRMPADS